MQTAITNVKIHDGTVLRTLKSQPSGLLSLNLREPFVFIHIDWSHRYPNSTSHRNHKMMCSLKYRKRWTLWPRCGYIFMTLSFFPLFLFILTFLYLVHNDWKMEVGTYNFLLSIDYILLYELGYRMGFGFLLWPCSWSNAENVFINSS